MPDAADNPLVLASRSPRRRELLARAGFAFEVRPPAVPEPARLSPSLSPAARAGALAYFKARSVAADDRRTVLGADTLVAVDDDVLGKPRDADEARAMLRRLSRSRHHVVTGVALLSPAGRRIEAETTAITMRPMTDEDIEAYVASDQWRGKAGGYAIRKTGDRFVTRVRGSFTNVVGLPMERVTCMLAEAGVTPRG